MSPAPYTACPKAPFTHRAPQSFTLLFNLLPSPSSLQSLVIVPPFFHSAPHPTAKPQHPAESLRFHRVPQSATQRCFCRAIQLPSRSLTFFFPLKPMSRHFFLLLTSDTGTCFLPLTTTTGAFLPNNDQRGQKFFLLLSTDARAFFLLLTTGEAIFALTDYYHQVIFPF